MADGGMRRRVRTGDRLSIPADTWDALMGMLEAYQRGRIAGGGPPASPRETASRVKVRNDSCGTVPQFGVLALRDWLVSPTASEATWGERRLYSGVEPGALSGSCGASGSGLGGSGPADEVVVILEEPLAVNAVGFGTVVGSAHARVNMTDASHRYAAPTDTTDHLISTAQAAGAAARIIQVESGTGVKRADVLLPAAGGCLGGTVRVRLLTGICRALSGSG